MQNRAPMASSVLSDQTTPTTRYLLGIFSVLLVMKTPKKIQIKQHLPPEEIIKLYKKEKNKKKAIRLLIIYHLIKGRKPKELAELFHIDQSTIYRIVQRWNKHGPEGLEDNKRGAENQQ